MRNILSRRSAVASAFFLLGIVTTSLVLHAFQARAVQSGAFMGLNECFAPRQTLATPGGDKIEVEIVALALVGLDPIIPDADPFPIAVVPQGSQIPGVFMPPDGTLQTKEGPFDVYFDVSLTERANILALPCNCMGNLCRGLGCPDDAGICRQTRDCLK